MRRTVGTVGIAGGIWLLGSGAAHAADDAAAQQPTGGPQAGSQGLLGNLLPADGAQQGVRGDAPPSTQQQGPLVPPGVLTFAPNQGQVALLPGPGGQVSNVLKGIPLSNVVPGKNLGGTQKSQPIANGSGTEALTGLPVLGGGLGGLPLAGDVTHGLPTGAAGDLLPLGSLGLGGQRTMHPMHPEAGLPIGGLPGVGSALGGAGGGLPLVSSLPLVGGLAGGGGAAQPSHAVNVMDDGSGSLAGSDSGVDAGSGDAPDASDPATAAEPGADQSGADQSGADQGAEHLPIFSSIPRVNGLV